MDHLAELFWALGEKGRLKILRLLAEEEKCVCELIEELELSQAAISHHLRILRKTGLIKVRRQGRWGFYSIDKEAFAGFKTLLNQELFQMVAKSPEGKTRISATCEKK